MYRPEVRWLHVAGSWQRLNVRAILGRRECCPDSGRQRSRHRVRTAPRPAVHLKTALVLDVLACGVPMNLATREWAAVAGPTSMNTTTAALAAAASRRPRRMWKP